MKPLRVRYKRIQAEVGRLLEEFAVSAAPVPVDRMAEGRGAQVVFTDFNKEVSGLLIRKPDQIIIAVANEQPEARQRFTLAHELGHLLLHDGDEVHVDKDFRVNLRSERSSTAEDIEEIEANTFAAELLMPYSLLRTDLNEFVIDLEDAKQVQMLAERYQVSTQAMTYRLLNLSRNTIVA